VADVTAAAARPATNLKGRIDDGVWLHLLPDPSRTLLRGRVPTALVAHLRRRGSVDRAPRTGSAYDLVVLDRRRSRRVGSDPELLEDVLASLRPGGSLLLLAADADPPEHLPATLLHLREGRIVHGSFPADLRERRHPRRAALLVGPVGGPRADPFPSHLVSGAASARHRRMEIRDEGRYRTKKVVFVVTGDSPGVLIKAVRDPRDNHRLENEARTLARVRPAVPWSTAIPRPLFQGVRHGRAFLGMELLDGTPFEDVLARQGIELAARATDRAVELGTATAHRTDPDALRQRLDELHSRFVHGFGPDEATRTALERQVAVLREMAAEIPSVVQHGDLGAWNLLVAPDGSVQVFDWEAGDLHGPPLWDLFYLVRSIASRSSTARGRHRRERAFAEHLLASTPLARLQAGAVERACQQTHIPAEAVLPLLVTCWMHRSVKQATRLPRHRVRRATAARVLRLVLAADDAPGLELLAARRDPCAS
jgi:aminoglycoside phosphotransferase (APT) family kinase protein